MKRWVTILLIVGFITGLYVSQTRLESVRLDISSGIKVENVPPLVAFSTLALGGFRTLFVNLLWLRALDLQEKERFFEMIQLADWITSLQPQLTNTWKFQIWNITYNIVAQFSEPQDRYRWLKKGIELLRNKGIAYNPSSPELYKELGLIFQLKMTLDHEQYHMHYKREWAYEMMSIFQGKVPDYDSFKNIPKNIMDLRKDIGVRKLSKAMKKRGLDILNDYFLIISKKIELDTELLEMLNEYKESFKQVSLFIRYQKLSEEYKLELERMEMLDKLYGPLDWTLPYAQAVYWGEKALEVAKSHKDIHAERLVYQSLQLGVYNGVLKVWEDGSIFLVPNLNIIPKLKKHYEILEIKYSRDFVKAPYRYFLEDAIELLYLYNRQSEALELFSFLKERFFLKKQEIPLAEFVINKMMEDARKEDDSEGFVRDLLGKGFWWLAIGEGDYAKGFFKVAQAVYERNMDKIIIPLDKIKEEILWSCLNRDFPKVVSKSLKNHLN